MTTISAQVFHLPSAEQVSAGQDRSVASVPGRALPSREHASGASAYSGSVISNKMASELRSLSSALSNTARGVSLVHKAEAGHNTIVDLIKQMKGLATDMATSTPTNADRTNAQSALSQLRDAVSQTVDKTTVNGQVLLDGQFARDMQLGISTGDRLALAFGSHKPSDFPVAQTVASLNISTQAGAQTAETVLADALLYLDGQGISIRAAGDRLAGTADMLTRSARLTGQVYERALSPQTATDSQNTRARLFDEAAASVLSRIRASSNLLPILLG